MVGAGERILERAKPGVLYADLAACNDYKDGAAAAAAVKVPALVIGGEKDQMTPLKDGRALSQGLAGSTFIAVDGAGHMLLSERPYEVQDAIAAHLKRLS